MIIIGYPGVGKTTASKQFIQVIDLDHLNTLFENYGYYCDIAEALSKQGYIVCVTSHEEVQKNLMRSKEVVYACYPLKSLKSVWANSARKRYMSIDDAVDEYSAYRAYNRIVEHFDSDIEKLSKRGFENLELEQGIFLSDILKESFERSIQQKNTSVQNETIETEDIKKEAEKTEDKTKDIK